MVSWGGREDIRFQSRCSLHSVWQHPASGERVRNSLAEANSCSREGACQSSGLESNSLLVDFHHTINSIVFTAKYVVPIRGIPSGKCVIIFLQMLRLFNRCMQPMRGEMVVMLLQATLRASRLGRSAISTGREGISGTGLAQFPGHPSPF